MSPPEIKSAGPPPERHAARVVAEMCQWLAREENGMRQGLARAMALALGRKKDGLGNPKAQARFKRRLLMSPARQILLGFEINKGTRGRFGFRMLVWTLLAPGGNPIEPDGPMPEKPWLAAVYEELWPKDETKDRSAYVCMMTHHAMQRLAERCKARTMDDLLEALREIALGMFEMAERMQEVGDCCRIPFSAGVAIVEHVDGLGWLVKTTLPLEEETPCPTV